MGLAFHCGGSILVIWSRHARPMNQSSAILTQSPVLVERFYPLEPLWSIGEPLTSSPQPRWTMLLCSNRYFRQLIEFLLFGNRNINLQKIEWKRNENKWVDHFHFSFWKVEYTWLINWEYLDGIAEDFRRPKVSEETNQIFPELLLRWGCYEGNDHLPLADMLHLGQYNKFSVLSLP